jgi:uncharacterized protein YndB with AHSA1/START domain
VDKVWQYWNDPEAIKQWYYASDDWHAPHAENDLKTDGKFKISMAAKDGSFSFDYEGVYSNVEENKKMEFAIADGRKVTILFSAEGNETTVTEMFEAESTHSADMQKQGWQAIMDNFKKFVERQ